MKEEIETIQSDALAAIEAASDEKSLDDARVAFLGKKGRLTAASAGMKDLSKEDKPVMGQLLNAALGITPPAYPSTFRDSIQSAPD